ncbi:MAG: efflux RND transporter permease subunit, partial [Pseudomonadota bacterium]|nr:efflux RND transporter permease subunit [Pseudomonadota bacterium]
ERSAFMGFGPGYHGEAPPGQRRAAVTLAIAKQPGQNAVDITRAVEAQLAALENIAIPAGVHLSITRNYGETAQDKANKLISKLLFATGAVIALVLLTLGWREAIIVGSAVVITLLITLFASWAWGFTINRVSLFALIFSIGILVDDAIVVVENIHRRMALEDRPLLDVIPEAVDEVGGPTILATFTVIAALMPMAFVSGLMGPYMSPIPINASMGMFISLAVAFVVTPWLARRLLRHSGGSHTAESQDQATHTWSYRLFSRMLRPFLRENAGRGPRWALTAAVMVLMVSALSLPYFQLVVLKMLPLDNKSELQLVIDMPEGTPVEQTQRVLSALGDHLETVPEVTHFQMYAGTSAPINFNGLVRQYYLRQEPHQGDIQVNLMDKHHRDRSSHQIALAMRPQLQEIGRRYDANVKVVEVPPGPPVLAPIVAEVYGAGHSRQLETARALRNAFEQTPDIVDVDDTLESPMTKRLFRVDRQKAALLGVPHAAIVAAITTATGGEDITYLHDEYVKYALPVRLEFAEGDKRDLETLLQLRVRSRSGALIPLSDVVQVVESQREQTLYHKDLLPVIYVTGDMAGEVDSPLYGMFQLVGEINDAGLDGRPMEQLFTRQPTLAVSDAIKWDGEWQITYETFRDMGIAYAVGVILIYLLVVGQFRSYAVPLVIMAPIPLTMIGIFPGHTLFGAQFTATSMIGMMALAGIIVRNSILLVDFINQQSASGVSFEEAVIRSGAVRAKPIVLTAVAATTGAFFILDDPIFSGLAVSLISGIAVSTALTLIVIPVMYYAFFRPRAAAGSE